jgi:hypothetical protein
MVRIFFITLYIFAPALVFAQDSVVLLEPTLPLVEQGIDLGGYLNALYQLGLGVATVLAVIMIIWGGLEYMTKDSIQSKSDGRNRITKALIGLLLAYGSWLILYTINPNLVSFQFLNRLKTQTGTGGNAPASGEMPQSEKDIRDRLKAAGININHTEPCGLGETTGCTTLAGLPEKAIQGLINLREACDCAITVTGGTESGHKTHGPGIPVVDVSSFPALSEYATKNGASPVTATTCPPGRFHQIRHFIFQWEPAGCHGVKDTHWHLIF